MSDLAPLQLLYEADTGRELPMPPNLAQLYGPFRLAPGGGKPYVLGNFVSTLDGVVSLGVPGLTGGGEISGYNRQDRLVMGLLRSVADAVIVGAGTLRGVPHHVWTAAFIYPSLAETYKQFRSSLGRQESPMTIIVTARGQVDLTLPVFQSGATQVLIVTTAEGSRAITNQPLPSWVQVAVVKQAGRICASEILEAANRVRALDTALVEGGPHLMGDFLAESLLSELFLTLAPQVAGRDESVKRPGLVEGRIFAPEHPLWGTLLDVRRGESHLFLRYGFVSEE